MSPEVLHLHAAVQVSRDFLQLHRLVIHLVVQLQDISITQVSGTGGKLIRIGTSEWSSIFQPIFSGEGK